MRDSVVNVGEDAVAEVRATVFGSGDDEVRLKDTIVLSGCCARSLIETVVVVTDNAKADITALTEAHAQGAEGRMNCTGLIKDKATASVSPLAKVLHPRAKVTQEGVLGGVENKALEALIARGLVPEDTADLVARGIVR
jgi:Fe-S cluster assembly scaffold protein SufB